MEEIKKVHLVVSKELQRNLKSIKIYPRETFGDIIERLIQERNKEVSPEISEEEIKLSSEEEKLVEPTNTTTASEGY